MKRFLINAVCLVIIAAGIYFFHEESKKPQNPHTQIYSVIELKVHLASLPQLFPNQIYVIQESSGNRQSYVFDDISQISLPESNWNVYLVTYLEKPSERDKQWAPTAIRFMYKFENAIHNDDISEQINQANTQEARLMEVSAQATAEAETGYNPVPNITINDSSCVAVGIEDNIQSVNCNITPQP